jgi:hopanoid biosynthesis associated RND transporter like protein HpnN
MNIATATRATLPPLVAFCSRHRIGVVLAALLLAALSLWTTQRYLGVTTDTAGMFANTLPWKQRSDDLARAFPQNDDLIVAVVDARIPEEAEATANALAASLRAGPTRFENITQPDALPYLQKNAFLLVDTPALQELLDRTVDAQPFLGQLAADPSLRGLFSALGLVAEGVAHGQSLAGVDQALAHFHAGLAAAIAGHPQPLSWQQLLAGKLSEQAGRFRFVLLKPHLDYGALEPGGVATDAVRAAAAALPYVKNGDARVRLTGSVVLDDEEFATVAKGAAYGLVGSFCLVMVWLYLAVRSWRIMLPIMLTLVLGLLLTTGFAAAAIGTLNLISVAFAVLFVGIAVDFAIQFSVRLRERRHTYPDMTDALRETGRRSGAQILVAALATAAGFLAFTPTNFVGVAQLGIIAGVGMLIAFLCTLTVLPALLCLCHPKEEPAEVGFAFARHLDPVVNHRGLPIVMTFAVLAALGAMQAPAITFDGNPLDTKNQHTEAIRTLHDLMQEPVTNPYTIEALEPSLAVAQQKAALYEKLPLTQDVLTLASFVPEDQPAKLALIADAASLLDTTLAPPARLVPVDAAGLRRSADTLCASLDAILPKLAPADPLRAIAGDVATLRTAPDATLLAANDALTRFLPLQLARLRTALGAGPVSEADVPAVLRRDWVLPDGQARVQVLPKAAVNDGKVLRRFVKAALRAVPDSTGSAVWILKSADTVTGAFRIAAYCAVAAIAIILSLALRRALDVALVMTPLLVSGLLTALVLRICGLSLNFANIIALPLLLGVGVSFNIYFVMNWRAGMTRFLGSATARAVTFSALTTSTAFGSLALSAHPGTASMGVLLLISLGCTVLTSLTFVPALLGMLPRPHVALAGVHG